MRFQKIFDKKSGDLLISIDQTEDVELSNPVEYFKNLFIVNSMVLKGVPFDELNGRKKPSSLSMSVFENAIKDWDEKLNQIRKVEIPDNLISLYGCPL